MNPQLIHLLSQASSDTAESTARNEYWEIGRGGVGVVFQAPEPRHIAIKLFEHAAHPTSERYQPARLGNDYLQHRKLELAWSECGANDLPAIPRLLAFLPGGEDATYLREDIEELPKSDEDFWSNQKEAMPEYWRPREGNDLLIMERIPALPSQIRQHLIRSYCPGSLQESVLQSDKDRDCLVRLYLGKRTSEERERPSRFFSLRNFKLKLDQALDEEIGLGWDATLSYAKSMARALATCHWFAGVDANDVEFVLGGPSTADHGFVASAETASAASLWMFDFDKSQSITEWNVEGMRRAAVAAEYNDPYFPRPCERVPTDSKLWHAFRDEYLSLSSRYLSQDKERRELPAVFIREWIAVRGERLAKRLET